MDVTGLAAAVVMPSGEIWTGAAGFANIEDATPLTAEAVFLIPDPGPLRLTAVTLRLIDHGTLGLADPAQNWLREENVPGVSDGVTIRHLLNHTSGIDDFVGDDRLWEALESGERLATGDVLRFVEEPHFPPGERWEWSGTNALLLAVVAEDARGMTYFNLVEDEVARPLGLARSFPDPRADVPSVVADGHADFDGDGTLEVTTYTPQWNRLKVAVQPIGILATNVGDAATVADALFRGDYISAATREQIMADSIDAFVPPWGDVRFGLGVMETQFFETGPALGMATAGLGYVGNIWHFPETGTTIVALVNEGPGPQPERAVEALASTVKHWND